MDIMCIPDRHSLVQDLKLSHHVYRVCVLLCLPVYSFLSRCCLFNNHQAKDYIDSFVTHCSRVCCKLASVAQVYS